MREYLKILKENLYSDKSSNDKELYSYVYRYTDDILNHVKKISNKPEYEALKSNDVFSRCLSNLEKTLNKFKNCAINIEKLKSKHDTTVSRLFIEQSIDLIVDIPFSGKDGAFSLRPLVKRDLLN